MIPTPDLSHLTKTDFDHVYEPAEDTFILLDALEQDAEELRDSQPRVCLEIGSGSGCVSAFLNAILGNTAVYLCSDINPHATCATLLTGRQNKAILDPVQASLAAPFLRRLNNSVDVLLFNPPYVPTIPSEADEAQSSPDIRGSWAGGHDGMAVTQKLLECVPDLLADGGRFYLVAVKQNDVPGIQRRMEEQCCLLSEVVMQRRAGREHLFVIKFFRHRPEI